jgi:hypothetical protein
MAGTLAWLHRSLLTEQPRGLIMTLRITYHARRDGEWVHVHALMRAARRQWRLNCVQ